MASRAQNLEARFRVGVAGGEVAHEGFAMGGGEFLKGGRNSIHVSNPKKNVNHRGHRDSQSKNSLWNSVFSVVQTVV